MTAFGPNGVDGTYDNRSRSVWQNFTVTPETVTISGQIFDHNGSPLQGAKVEALLGGPDGNVIASDTTDASGGYGLIVPVDNTYTIRLTAAGYARITPVGLEVIGDLVFDLAFEATDVDNTAPSISNYAPADGSTVSEGRPEISAFLSDDHAGIDPETIVFTLDGVQVNFSYSEFDGRLSFTPVGYLDNGSHTVTVDVLDYAQNPAVQAAWSFTVDAKVLGDLNCDYSLDLADAIIALQILIDNPPQTFCFSDVDGDGKTGMAEALYVLQKVAGVRGHLISYAYVQYRRYAGSDPFQRRIWAEVTDSEGMPSGDVLRSLTVKDPNGDPLSFLYLDYSQEVTYVSHYNDSTGGWDEDLDGNLEAGYYGRIDTNLLEVGDYTFTAVDTNGETLPPVTYTFNGEESNLPVVDSNTIIPIWNGDGSLTVQWSMPDTTGLDPNDWHSNVAIYIYQDGQYSNHGYFGRAPLTHGYIVLSADMVAKLQSLGDELRCRVRIRKNDNSQRSYSNFVTIWSTSYPSNYIIDYVYVQYRRYGDGSTRRQIWVDVRDSLDNQPGDVLSSLELLDNSGQPFNFSSLGFYQATEYYAWYNPASGGWDENLQGNPASGYSGRIDTPSLGPGNYTFTAVDTSQQDLVPRTYIFKGEYPNLPVVDSNTINDTWHGDGSLTIDWDLPAEVQSLDPAEWRMDVFIDVRQSGSSTGIGYFGRLPLDLTPQHIDLSPDMVAILQSLGDELHCRVRVRKNDNSYRSYSNPVTIWTQP
jgi:hypothetical protein